MNVEGALEGEDADKDSGLGHGIRATEVKERPTLWTQRYAMGGIG